MCAAPGVIFSCIHTVGWIIIVTWYILSLCCIQFYTSNLRAHLVATEREDKIDTTQDVIANGKTVWLFRSEVRMK